MTSPSLCPTAQAYQERIKRLVNEYSSKGVKIVAINPNHADAVRLDEMAWTDVGDSFAEMQERAKDLVIIASIEDPEAIAKILAHLERTPPD